jgi:hypothetical protein
MVNNATGESVALLWLAFMARHRPVAALHFAALVLCRRIEPPRNCDAFDSITVTSDTGAKPGTARRSQRDAEFTALFRHGSVIS